MTVEDWLLDSDPALRWQVMRDLTGASEADVGAERARVAGEGWGARLLALQAPNGQWGGGTLFPVWTSTAWTLMLLYHFGLDPATAQARRAVALVRENSRWEHAGQPFFSGEVEPCINGRTVAIGAYFGEDIGAIVDRLADEQMADGGWRTPIPATCTSRWTTARAGRADGTPCAPSASCAGLSGSVSDHPRHRQAAVRAQRHLGLLLEPGYDVEGVAAHDGRVRPVEGVLRVSADQASASMGVRSSGRKSGRIRRNRTACRHRPP
ncbi:hypothetical protein [Actinopolymorpha sp. B9G3]|uniref:hypothetical protein n=1 Tax=Actinopolymorpha sp. B9G3 TaxID=3158970 RepID=UPI0032D8F287